MPVGFQSDLVSSATDAEGVATLPAGTTLIRARLATYTSFVSSTNTSTIPFSPPNTLFGVYWAATGGSVPVITAANFTNSEWYVSGYGEMTAVDKVIVFAFSPAPAFTDVQHTYASFIDLESPNYQSGSFDIGFSFNFLGSTFWPNLTVRVGYQLTYWYD